LGDLVFLAQQKLGSNHDNDPTLGTFISPDTPVPDAGVVFDYNRYLYVRGNPLKYTDPSGHGPETIWDIINIGIGIASLSHNVSQGNWGDAAWDAGGILVDAAATMVPMVPGGASSAIRAKRLAAAAKWAPAEAEISHKLQRAITATAAETPGLEIAVFGRAAGANALDDIYPAKPDTLDEVARLPHDKRLMSDDQIYVSDLDLAVVTIDGIPVTDEFVRDNIVRRINRYYGYDVVRHTDHYNGVLRGNEKALAANKYRVLQPVYRFRGSGYGGSMSYGAFKSNNIFAQ
jgi:hypothetical protein